LNWRRGKAPGTQNNVTGPVCGCRYWQSPAVPRRFLGRSSECPKARRFGLPSATRSLVPLLVIHGLHTRPGNPDETIQLASGEQREVRFRTGKAGTDYYWATTTGKALPDRYGVDSQLNRALIVDPQGTRADDRVFVIGWRENPELRAMGGDPFTKGRNAIVINGRAWPYTERLKYGVGDSVHWRWIDAAQGNHPMYLHGSCYTVDSIGDAPSMLGHGECSRTGGGSAGRGDFNFSGQCSSGNRGC